jgi:predicted kinase
MSRETSYLIMTIGLPYSGKSVWAKGHSKEWPIVSPDQIRYALHGHRFLHEAEPFVWATAKIMVRALFLAGHKTIVLDACNVTAARRDDWIDNLWYRKYVVMDISAEACINRALKADDEYIVPVIKGMAEKLEYDGVLYGGMDSTEMIIYVENPAEGKQVYHEGRAAEH